MRNAVAADFPTASEQMKQAWTRYNVRRTLWVCIAFLFVTVALGVAMRWDQTSGGLSVRGWSFANLRHAHSHAGFYGLLTLASWATAPTQGHFHRWFVIGYACCACVASVLFSMWGYGVSTIVLSCCIAAAWMWASWQQREGTTRNSWTAGSFIVLGSGVMLIPAIAFSARHDIHFSRQLAHFFIAWLLLGVFVPSLWQSLGVIREVKLSWYFGAVAAGLIHVVFGASLPWWSGAGALISVVVLGRIVWRMKRGIFLRLLWTLLPASMLLSLVPHFQAEGWRIFGLHVWILGVVLPSFAMSLQKRPQVSIAWLSYAISLLLMWGCMAIALVKPEAGLHSLVALSSTLFAVVAVISGALFVKKWAA